MPDRCAADARSSGASDCTARWHTFVLPKADTESRNWAIRMEYALPLVFIGVGALGAKDKDAPTVDSYFQMPLNGSLSRPELCGPWTKNNLL